MDASAELTDIFSTVARDLAAASTMTDLLVRVTASAVQHVPGAEEAAISVIRQKARSETVAETSELCTRIDAAQYRTGQGPCLEASWIDEIVRVDDLRTTDRWPDFSAAAVELGVLAMLAFPLYLDGTRIGALNLYSRVSGSFDESSVRSGRVLAAHAAVAYDSAHEIDGLRSALETRGVIGQAQGIIMARHAVGAETAFSVLRDASQARNVRLRVVAQEIVDGETGGARAQARVVG